MKTKIQTDQAQGISKDSQSNHEGPNQDEVQSISKSFPVNHGFSKALEGVL